MKVLKIMIVLLLIYIFTFNVYATSIEKVDIVDDKNINIFLSKDVSLLKWELDSEIKILKNIKISSYLQDIKNKHKVVLNLEEELEKNINYSLYDIDWPKWSIDFSTKNFLDNEEIDNNLVWENQWIQKVIIKNSKVMELYYNNPITETEFNFKFLKEFNISKLIADDNSILMTLDSSLKEHSDYIIMLLWINNKEWTEIVFDKYLYDFSVEEIKVIEEGNLDDWNEKEQEENIQNDDNIDLEKKEDKIISESKENLEVSKEVVIQNELKWNLIENSDIQNEEWNIEEVSLNAASTPDTWTASWIIIIFTFIVSAVVFFRKRFFS